MPTYNQGHLIKTSLKCMLSQDFRDFHLTVVDDGSTDDTVDVITKMIPRFLERKISMGIWSQGHMNASAALNWGFLNSGWVDAEYETWISSDNLFYPKFLLHLVELLDERPKFDFAYSDFALIDEVGDRTGVLRRKPYSKDRLESVYEQGICFLWRKALRMKAGFWFDERLQCQDYNMVLRMAEHGDFIHLPQILGAHRVHKAQVGTRGIAKHTLEARKLFFLWKQGNPEGVPETYLTAWLEERRKGES